MGTRTHLEPLLGSILGEGHLVSWLGVLLVSLVELEGVLEGELELGELPACPWQHLDDASFLPARWTRSVNVRKADLGLSHTSSPLSQAVLYLLAFLRVGDSLPGTVLDESGAHFEPVL